jgi:hypothetical protein
MYKISDLYIAAFLKSIWFEYTIEAVWKRCYFIFPDEAKKSVEELVVNSDRSNHNVNASLFINEIKQLKAYVNNL